MMETVAIFLIALIFLLGPPMITSYVIWLVLKKFKVERFSLLRIFFFSVGIWGAIISIVMGIYHHGAPPEAPSLPAPAPKEAIPRFPWPPPLASAETMIPRNWLSTMGAPELADVADRLERALNEAKYRRWSYSSVPNGFA